MASDNIRLGMIGGGEGSLIGIVHRISAYMVEKYTLVGGVFNSDFQKSERFADGLELDLSRVYRDDDEFIKGELALDKNQRIEVVTVATPNHLHFDTVRKLIKNGFHVICEKPITMTVNEAEELNKLITETNLVFGVAHTYTGYPMVRQMREMISEGLLGQIQKVDAQYYQGWINPFIHSKEERSKVWRLNPKYSGESCCIGDIGVHAFNMLEYVTGMQVTDLLSDLSSFYDDNPLDVDGSIFIRMNSHIRGQIRASQIATGEENNFRIAIYGRDAGVKWEQENPNYLIFMKEGQPMQILKPGNAYTSDFEKESVKLPAGHPEGIFDAMGNIYAGVAKAVRNKEYRKGSFPTIGDGVRGMKFINTAVASSKEGNIWKTIN